MIDVQSSDGIVTVRLQHGKANALDVELCETFTKAMKEMAQDNDARGVVVTGNGGIFSAGVDLVRVVEGGQEYLKGFLPTLRSVLEALFLFPKPVAVAINGHAIGGGCVMACAADVRIMARGPGVIGIPELRVGIPFPSVALETMRFALPATSFRRLVYSGETLRVEEAREAGLVDAVAPPDSLLDRARESLHSLLAIPANSFRISKQQIRLPATERMVKGRQDDEKIDAIWAQPQTMAAIQAYVEKNLKKRS